MNQATIDEIQSKLLNMNKFISKLEPAIRGAAFEILTQFYFDDKPITKKIINKDSNKKPSDQSDDSELESYLKQFDDTKPKKNVKILVAWLYSQYGAYPIKAKDIRDLANSIGLVVPNRPDNTMRQAMENGKHLFTQKNDGWILSVTGEMYMKNTYNVKKGNKSIPKR